MHERVLITTAEEKTLALKDIDFKLPNIRGHLDPLPTYESVYNNIPIIIKVESKRNQGGSVDMDFWVYEKSDQGKPVATFGITIGKRKKRYTAGTSVENFDSDPQLKTERKFKGLGGELWEISTKIYQKFSNHLHSAVLHVVHRIPLPNLSDEEWDRVFVPLLLKHGYVQDTQDPGRWTKTYLPQA